ncbi:Putative thiosulfate sulfurtransferase [Candidatus Calditenuaceae archaeon HR02]|nr:Putative thiosulfate sulfurtransferase [Candidatus Calditenuaceae archaeon HR02]
MQFKYIDNRDLIRWYMSEEQELPVLVSTEWVAKNLNRPDVRVVEVDYDPQTAYFQGHVRGAVLWDWKKDINDPIERNIISKEGFESLCSRSGISNDTHIVLYGDFNNWFAAFAFWVARLYGHQKLSIMDGGRKKWIAEERELVKEAPSPAPTSYKVTKVRYEYRILLPDVRARLGSPTVALVDVRSPDEYTGKILAPPEYPTEHAQRGGHIPGAVNIPWARALNEDGTFKPIEELRRLYQGMGVTPDKEVITYCRIGERSSVTWFVLKELLKYPKVRNYDGSWSEWGNVVGTPIEK